MFPMPRLSGAVTQAVQWEAVMTIAPPASFFTTVHEPVGIQTPSP